jgi:hypothetical protein
MIFVINKFKTAKLKKKLTVFLVKMATIYVILSLFRKQQMFPKTEQLFTSK